MKFLLFAPLLVVACENGRVPPAPAVPQRQESLIDENKRWLERESRDIELWVMRQQVAFTKTGTGVRWRMVRDVPGEPARPEQLARVNYLLTLLNGDTCYFTPPGAPESFRVEHDEVESGLHEAVQFMSAGDSAIVVIPSHRAHGLAGDLSKVPMRSTVVYHIGLEKLTSPRK